MKTDVERIKDRPGRPCLKKTMEHFMARPWSLADAQWHLSLESKVIPENQKLLELIRQTTMTPTQEEP